MHIGILAAGRPPGRLIGEHGDFAAMMARMLGPAHSYQAWNVYEGAFPDADTKVDAWIVTGSPASVYDDDAWIARLGAFLRAQRGRVPIVGICFGHQMLAQAFGGKVAKADVGWGLGVQEYQLTSPADATLRAIAVHQDQVVQPPADAQLLASSDFTPVAALAYPDGAALSFQFHPEFTPEFTRALVAMLPAPGIGDATRAKALASLDHAPDAAPIVRWIGHYLQTGDTQPPVA